MELINLLDPELRQTGGNGLLPDFIQRVGRVKRSKKIAPEHGRRFLRMLIHKTKRRLGVGRPKQINDQYGTTRLYAFRSRSPERDRIQKMVQQTVGYRRIETLFLQ